MCLYFIQTWNSSQVYTYARTLPFFRLQQNAEFINLKKQKLVELKTIKKLQSNFRLQFLEFKNLK